jgi:uncharacterized protein YjiS (DUF1127 family)
VAPGLTIAAAPAYGVTEMSTLTLRIPNNSGRTTLVMRVRAAGRAFLAQRQRRLGTCSLEAMDDKLLKDIGISRAEIGWAVYSLRAVRRFGYERVAD